MTDSIIERSARALCKLDGHPENITFEGAPMWQSYVPQARAVLQAIREPTEVMVKAAEGVDFICPGENDFVGEWQAAIDKALEE